MARLKVDLPSLREFSLEFDGKEYVLRDCTMGDLEDLVIETEEIKDNKKANKRAMEFLEMIGLPQEVYKKMSPEQIKAIMDAVTSKKK